jgi:hypothetical protein
VHRTHSLSRQSKLSPLRSVEFQNLLGRGEHGPVPCWGRLEHHLLAGICRDVFPITRNRLEPVRIGKPQPRTPASNQYDFLVQNSDPTRSLIAPQPVVCKPDGAILGTGQFRVVCILIVGPLHSGQHQDLALPPVPVVVGKLPAPVDHPDLAAARDDRFSQAGGHLPIAVPLPAVPMQSALFGDHPGLFTVQREVMREIDRLGPQIGFLVVPPDGAVPAAQAGRPGCQRPGRPAAGHPQGFQVPLRRRHLLPSRSRLLEYETAVHSAYRQPFQAHHESSDQQRQDNERKTNRFHEVVCRSTEPQPNFNRYVSN